MCDLDFGPVPSRASREILFTQTRRHPLETKIAIADDLGERLAAALFEHSQRVATPAETDEALKQRGLRPARYAKRPEEARPRFVPRNELAVALDDLPRALRGIDCRSRTIRCQPNLGDRCQT